MQSVPIITNVVSSNPTLGTLISSINKTDPHDVADILLKVALSTINLALTLKSACPKIAEKNSRVDIKN
jgi:hypothetical protein